MLKHDLTKYFFVAAVILISILSGILWRLHVNIFYAYLIGVSVISFIFYGYDKRQAIMNRIRVPELLLHILALLGGTPGAFLGQIFFRHKTKKLWFRIVFFVILLFQAGIIFCYWRYWKAKS